MPKTYQVLYQVLGIPCDGFVGILFRCFGVGRACFRCIVGERRWAFGCLSCVAGLVIYGTFPSIGAAAIDIVARGARILSRHEGVVPQNVRAESVFIAV